MLRDASVTPWGWDNHLLADAMAGDYTPTPRGILHREDSEGLLYPGHFHAVVAEPGGAKTLFAAAAIIEVALKMPIVLIDFEMGPKKTARRLQLLGMDLFPESTFGYAWDPDDIGTVIAETHCTGLLTEHATTASNERGRKRGAMGNTKKLAGVDVSYYLKPRQHGDSAGRAGRYDLYLDKDRPSDLQAISNVGQKRPHLATMHTVTFGGDQHSGGILTVRFTKPEPGGWQPTALMERASRWIEKQDTPVTKSAFEAAIGGKAEYARHAIDTLVNESYVARTAGPNRSSLHTSIRPYREGQP